MKVAAVIVAILSSASTAKSSCADDPAWRRVNSPTQGCEDVKKNPRKRCNWVGADTFLAWDGCQESCGTCTEPCGDDLEWSKRNKPFRTCSWVAQLPSGRCGVLGGDGRRASEACLEACGVCGRFTAPHEVHQHEQVKFFNESMWDCTFESIGDVVGCLKCSNSGEIGDDALIVEVKAQYKRTDWNVRNETLDPPRKHCIWPGRGDFWTCFNSNLVIEPDTDWLGNFTDKPIYDENGDEGGDMCLPGSIVAGRPYNGAEQPFTRAMAKEFISGGIQA